MATLMGSPSFSPSPKRCAVTRQLRNIRARAARKWSGQLSLAAIAALAFAAPAVSTQRLPKEFEMVGQLASPSTAAGTWSATGPIEAAGTYTETFSFAGETIHSRKVLIGAGGTIVLEIRAVVVWLDACTAGFKAGSWHISDATGAYDGLEGGGAPAATVASFGNVCTGVIDVAHEGAVRDD
jgi:hypothetical protein